MSLNINAETSSFFLAEEASEVSLSVATGSDETTQP